MAIEINVNTPTLPETDIEIGIDTPTVPGDGSIEIGIQNPENVKDAIPVGIENGTFSKESIPVDIEDPNNPKVE